MKREAWEWRANPVICLPMEGHQLVTVYSRPWWNWFRETYEIQCAVCQLRIAERKF